MRVVILVENHDGSGCPGEHGLSIYIEYEGCRILLDTGTTGLFAENARKLGVDLSKIDMAVLSHAHYDHSGGFPELFAANDHVLVYLQQSCAENCYRESSSGVKYIGIPEGILEQHKERFIFADNDRQLWPGVWLLAHHTADLAQTGRQAKMLRLHDNNWQWDDFAHEQSLVFETKKGLVVFNSCCHAGADVIVREVQQAFPDRQIYSLIGGFHLKDIMKAADGAAKVSAFGRRLNDLNVDWVYTGHCTGDEAYAELEKILGNRLQPLYTGMEIFIGPDDGGME